MADYQYDPNQRIYSPKFGDLGNFNWAYKLKVGDDNDLTTRYGVTFSTDKGNYTFIPEEVVKKGFVSLYDNNQNFFTSFLDPDFIKNFQQNSQYVNLNGVVDPTSWNYMTKARPTTLADANPSNPDVGYGWSGKGFLVPESTFQDWKNNGKFSASSYELGKRVGDTYVGAIEGLAMKDGQYVYAPSTSGASNAYSYINPDGTIHGNWTRYERRGGLFGGFLGNLFSDLGSTINSLGPLGTLALDAISPGLGTNIALGAAAGNALGTGELNLAPLATNLAAAQLGSNIGVSSMGDLGKAAIPAVNALGAAQSGNVLGALTSATNIPGASQYIDPSVTGALRTANQVSGLANAIDKDNVLGALNYANALAGTGGTQIGDTGATVGQALAAANAAKTLENLLAGNQPGAIANAANAMAANASSGASRGPSAGPSTVRAGAQMSPAALAALQNAGVTPGGLGMPQIGIPNVLPFETAPGVIEGHVENPDDPLKALYASQQPAQPGAAEDQGTPDMLENPVNKLAQLFGSLTPEMKNVMAKNMDIHPDIVQASQNQNPYDMSQTDDTMNMASGGSTSSSWLDSLNYRSIAPAVDKVLKAAPVVDQATKLRALKQLRQSIAQNSPFAGSSEGMARGGLPSKYHEAAPDGHHPEFVTGLTGYYAGGRGTGQSDDIPAMLHDGDYVIDAEAVSAFGDGSSKAGKDTLTKFLHQIPHKDSAGGNPVPAKIADGEFVLPASFVTALGGGDNKRGAKMLDQMRQKLRAHKRSAPNSKIPPKAKSPLEYLKGAKG